MIKGRDWAPRLEKIRLDKYQSKMSQAADMGICWRTYCKIMHHNEYPAISYVINHKIEDYLKAHEHAS